MLINLLEYKRLSFESTSKGRWDRVRETSCYSMMIWPQDTSNKRMSWLRNCFTMMIGLVVSAVAGDLHDGISMVPFCEFFFSSKVLKDNNDLIWRDVAYQETGENELAQERVKRDNKYISRRIKASGRRHLIPFNSTLLLLHTSHSVLAGLRGICFNLWKVLSRTLWRDRIE